MLTEVMYVVLVMVVLTGGALLLERLVAGGHTTAGTGYARVDTTFDLERAGAGHYGTWARDRLQHRTTALAVLPQLATLHAQLRDRGEQLIPVDRIVGSVDGAPKPFDRHFRPVGDRARARLSSILATMRQDEPLPPIDVWAWRGGYWVVDGHHRVAAARALGRDVISAHVIDVS